MPGPMSPDEIVAARPAIPEQVFEVFNSLIARSRFVRQDEVVERLVELGFDREQIFSDHMLDVENAYRAKGWNVTYNRPVYNEEGSASFTFSRKRED